jgi:hypothetical protein
MVTVLDLLPNVIARSSVALSDGCLEDAAELVTNILAATGAGRYAAESIRRCAFRESSAPSC